MIQKKCTSFRGYNGMVSGPTAQCLGPTGTPFLSQVSMKLCYATAVIRNDTGCGKYMGRFVFSLTQKNESNMNQNKTISFWFFLGNSFNPR